MFPFTRPERMGAAGFTLIEALVALAVLAGGLAAVGQLAGANLHAGLRTEQHIAEVETARKIMTGMPARDALPFGNLTGALDSYAWRIEATAVGGSPNSDEMGWAPQNIALLVRSPSGATVEVDMIRLRKLSPK